MFRFSLLGAVAAFSDETSLMQGMKPVQEVKKNHKGAVANLLESAKGMLKNGETADVVEFAAATLAEIRGTVIPAIQDAHNVEQVMVNRSFAAFETALVTLTLGVSEVHQLDQEEFDHHVQHFNSREEEHVICGHKRECDYELYALWRTFIDEESDVRHIEDQIYNRNSGHFCAEDAHGNYIMNGTTHEFRETSVPIMNDFTRQWPIVVQAEVNYDLKVPICEAFFESLDQHTATSEGHQHLEEESACQHRRKAQQVREDFECDWSNAREHYDLTEKESRLMMIDRIREFQALSTVECLLDRTTERNGRPCDEHTDELDTEIAHCEQTRRDVDTTWLEIIYECEVRECGNLPNGIGPHLHEDGRTLPGCDGPLVCPALPPSCQYDGDVVIASRCYPDSPVHPCTEGQIFAGLPLVPQPDFHSSNSHCNQRTPCQACDLPEPRVCLSGGWAWNPEADSVRYGSAEYHAIAGTQPAPVTQAPVLPAVPAVCPAGWLQVGEAGGDIGGCGLQTCSERYTTVSEAECAASCDTMEECDGFSYAPLHGDRNHEDTTVCTLYNSNVPTGTWTGSAGTVQVFCGREDGGSASQCAPDALERCQGNTPCIDLREGVNHHHLMWLNSDGTAHVDGEANGIGAGDSRTWTCTPNGNTVGLVGFWNCPGFYSEVITITADFADDFTPARDNDFIHVCALPEQEHTGYGQPCTEGTATIDGVPVCTVASQDGSSSPWVLMGDIDHQISNFVSSQVTSSATSSGLHQADSVQVGTFSTGSIGSSGYSLDVGQFCAGGSCGANFDLMIQYGDSDVFSHSETGYSTTSGGFINNGHTAQGVVIGEHGMWGSNTDRPNGNYATFCAYNGGCRGNGNDFWAFSTHGVYPNAANSVVCGMYYGGSGTPWKNCPSGDNGQRMRYYIRSSDLQVTLLDPFTVAPVSEPVTIEYLVVAGGGGGGSGGGGAGGVLQGSMDGPIAPVSIMVGSGGSHGSGGASTSLLGSSGSNSQFGSSVVAIGGGYGGGAGTHQQPADGGSGGGGRYDMPSITNSVGTVGQGFGGGRADRGGYGAGGGGGGAGGVGSDAPQIHVGGAGGPGVESNVGCTVQWYGGGGGGGVNANDGVQDASRSGPGGQGGGGLGSGHGGSGGGPWTGTHGDPNTGGGGGGTDPESSISGNGGSGIVVLKYLGPPRYTGGTTSTCDGYTVHSFLEVGTSMLSPL